MENNKSREVDISLLSLFRIVAFILGAWLLYVVRDILLIILVVAIITIALEPYVEKLEEDGVPRSFSVIVLYLALLVVLGLFIYFLIPPVAQQIRELTLNFPYYASRLDEFNLSEIIPVSDLLNGISSSLSNASASVISAVISIFGGVVSAVTVFALTYYSLVEKEGVRKVIAYITPVGEKQRLYSTIEKVSNKLGIWLRSQLTIMLTIGILNGVILTALGIEYALTLGLLSAILEIVPVIGPITAGLIAVLVAFVSGAPLWKIIVIVVLFILVQQLESQVLVPRIMQKTIGLSPVVVILAILIGAQLLGISGAILAVPIAAGLQVFLREYFPNFGKLK